MLRAPEPVSVFFSGGGTGGHLYPALALAAALQRARPDVTPFFVGASRGLEARVLPARALPHLLLGVEGFRRGGGKGVLRDHLRTVGKLLRGMLDLLRAFRDRRPSLVVVTGGYAGAPSGILALALGVPLVIQEQNATPGITTRLLALGARRIYLAFPEAVARLPRLTRGRVWVEGNPVAPPVEVDREASLREWGLDPNPNRPVLLVVGGSQGSLALNRGVLALLDLLDPTTGPAEGLPGGFQLLWATGPTHEAAVRDAVVQKWGSVPAWMQIRGYVDEMHRALGVADLALSRAGAMGTSEFQAWGVPAILVPLPTAAADHQTGNARALEAASAAILVPESELTGACLADMLKRLGGAPETLRAMADAARERGQSEAAARIARGLGQLLPPPFPRAPLVEPEVAP
jgi:UDP-N-acetylglucosamine--N-acetylmuramyl-(pentapeptide) pyrophosphoryl-undecaprenol N-acetylglucosamine transferase